MLISYDSDISSRLCLYVQREVDMEFFDVIHKRYSVRAYKPDPVEDARLEKILEAAVAAPTACNLQPFRIIVIHTQGKESELQRIYPRQWFVQAPLVICICGMPSKAWSRNNLKNYCDVDVAIAMDHLILAATDLGLGTCWIGAFDPQAAREILHLPQGVEPVAFTPLGYAADMPGNRHGIRRPVAEMVNYERWCD
jgi:nitroreductase